LLSSQEIMSRYTKALVSNLFFSYFFISPAASPAQAGYVGERLKDFRRNLKISSSTGLNSPS